MVAVATPQDGSQPQHGVGPCFYKARWEDDQHYSLLRNLFFVFVHKRPKRMFNIFCIMVLKGGIKMNMNRQKSRML